MTTVTTAGQAPARTLPLLYLGAAHVSLGLACVVAGIWPQAAAGFFYHSWMVALVHLVTLGWITFSILGAIYLVAPLALRMEMQPHRADYLAFVLAVIGLIGMVAHFWIGEFAGMAFSAATIALAVAFMTFRIAASVRRATLPDSVKAHIVLACANFWIAASMGVLIAYDKVAHILPGFVLSNVFAHAHLAALGWATMMVIGVGYRLLPMMFPSKMPSGRSVYASAVLLEIGVLGLFIALLRGSTWALAPAVFVAAGIGIFAADVAWMLRHRVSRPIGAPWLDFGLLHAGFATISLLLCVAIGLGLLVTPMSPRTLHAAAAYGVLGLVGFLGQMIVAMEARLLPMAAWFWAYSGSGYVTQPPSPHAMRNRHLQALVLGGWMVGVPALAAGLYLESARLVSVGAWSLFAGVAVAAVDNVFLLM